MHWVRSWLRRDGEYRFVILCRNVWVAEIVLVWRGSHRVTLVIYNYEVVWWRVLVGSPGTNDNCKGMVWLPSEL